MEQPDESKDELANEPSPTLDILERMAAGDPQAIDALYRRYEGRILADISRKAGPAVLARIEKEDLRQEVVARSLKRVREYKPADLARLRWWFQKLAEDIIVEEARKWKAGKRSAHGEVSMHNDERPVEVRGADPTPSRVLSREETNAIIARCIAELPEQDRQMIDLRVRQGLPFKVIGEMLGIAEEAASMRESRARQRLKKLLAEEGIDG